METYTIAKVTELNQVKVEVLHITEMTEEMWLTSMFEVGCKFAEVFSKLMPYSKTLLDTMLLTKPQPGEEQNFFWAWWKFTWMQDDQQYINNKLYTQLNYLEYKCYLVGNELLERQLLEEIDRRPLEAKKKRPLLKS